MEISEALCFISAVSYKTVSNSFEKHFLQFINDCYHFAITNFFDY